jgi:hypothetical protein
VFFSQEPDNGYILRDESSKNLTVGSTVKFKCRLGYILHGSNISTCQGGGQWSYDNTTCARKYHTELHFIIIMPCCLFCFHAIPSVAFLNIPSL